MRARVIPSRFIDLADTRLVVQVVLWGLTFFSAIAFSASTFLARLFSQHSLPNLIQFQSTSVFLAFVVQAGLRAGLRNQFHLGRKKVVEEVEKKILKSLPWLSAIVSFLFLLQSRFDFCPAFAILHATLTLLIGLRIAQNRLSTAAIWSVLTFISIVIPCLLLMFSGLPFARARIPIEAMSLVSLFLLGRGRSPSPMAWTALKKVLKSSIGLQLGSFSVYLLVFVFGQYVVFLSRQDIKIGVAYADIQVICGVQSLIISRLYLLVEGRMVKGGKILGYSLGFILWAILFSASAFAAVSLKKNPYIAVFYAALSFSYLGNIPLGIISQFMRERYRVESLIMAGLASALLAGGIYLQIEGEPAAILIGFSSPAFLAIVLTARSFLTSGYFIQPGACATG